MNVEKALKGALAALALTAGSAFALSFDVLIGYDGTADLDGVKVVVEAIHTNETVLIASGSPKTAAKWTLDPSVTVSSNTVDMSATSLLCGCLGSVEAGSAVVSCGGTVLGRDDGNGQIVVPHGSVLGWIDYARGRYAIDPHRAQNLLRLWKPSVYGTATNVYVGTSGTLAVSATAQARDGFPIRVHVEKAVSGLAREDVVCLSAYADLDGDGVFDPGEPYGATIVRDEGEVSVTLSETSDDICRMDILGTFDAGTLAAKNALSDRGTYGSYYTNCLASYHANVKAIPSRKIVRYRIVRFDMNDDTDAALGVLIDHVVDIGEHPFITEVDVYCHGIQSLDLNGLRTAWARANGSDMSRLTKIGYNIVLGNGGYSADEAQIPMCGLIFKNAFLCGSSYNGTNVLDGTYSAERTPGRHTFRWRNRLYDADNIRIKRAPAYRLMAWDGSGDDARLVYDSGVRVNDERDAAGYFYHAADLVPGGRSLVGPCPSNVWWNVAMVDAKFTSAVYAGPRAAATLRRPNGAVGVNLSYSGSYVSTTNVGAVLVQAYADPSFENEKVGEAVATGASVSVAVTGPCYLRAFVDADGNGRPDGSEVCSLCTVTNAAARFAAEPMLCKPGDTVSITLPTP